LVKKAISKLFVRYGGMKKLIIIVALLVTFKSYSQNPEPIKNLWLGVGPTWGTLGWGGNVNLSYDASKKLSIKLRGVLGSNKEKSYGYQYYGVIQGSLIMTFQFQLITIF
jgi:hypothetical protein